MVLEPLALLSASAEQTELGERLHGRMSRPARDTRGPVSGDRGGQSHQGWVAAEATRAASIRKKEAGHREPCRGLGEQH